MKLKLTKQTRMAATVAASLFVTFAAAQTFTQQVQKQRSGEGIVTIHHDTSIDRLVNAASAAHASSATAATTAPKTTEATTAPKTTAATTAKKTAAKPETPKTEKPKAKTQTDTAKARPQADTAKAGTAATTVRDTAATAGTDTVAAALRHGYKTTGYRVQAFAGGNTRKDRQKAERTGNAMRQLLPGEDVYVRFYSPRWVCRVGNYRTYEEAHEKMLLIRKQGYETATIVKGKIIVYHD